MGDRLQTRIRARAPFTVGDLIEVSDAPIGRRTHRRPIMRHRRAHTGRPDVEMSSRRSVVAMSGSRETRSSPAMRAEIGHGGVDGVDGPNRDCREAEHLKTRRQHLAELAIKGSLHPRAITSSSAGCAGSPMVGRELDSVRPERALGLEAGPRPGRGGKLLNRDRKKCDPRNVRGDGRYRAKDDWRLRDWCSWPRRSRPLEPRRLARGGPNEQRQGLLEHRGQVLEAGMRRSRAAAEATLPL